LGFGKPPSLFTADKGALWEVMKTAVRWNQYRFVAHSLAAMESRKEDPCFKFYFYLFLLTINAL
jgi:hypothetical protein